ncbi:MAG TPA: glycosyltransferase [Candidatus Tectomicrobia bacterium]|nr:glycosyltransferase [Candidatus Tectomicrobia bacterium]
MRSTPCEIARGVLSGLAIDGLVVMYVGNLEPYQGIDLLLASFARVCRASEGHALVVVGGSPRDVEAYRTRCQPLGIAGRTHFLGPRPVRDLGRYLAAADVLVSPRLQGTNTPMKLYSYLHSGKPLVATDLPTHTQLLDDRVAVLAAPTPEALGDAIARVLGDADLRARLGHAGRRFVEDTFTYQAFRERLTGLLDWLEARAPTAGDATRSGRAR